jgi:Tol biopolymer transport system component
LGSYVPDTSDPWRQTGTSLSSIWIINSDGNDPRRLTTDSAYEQRPYWSRDGQSVTFLSNRNDGEYGMWTSRVDGSGQPEPAEGGCLSPDGTRIAYLTEDEDLWLKDADGSNAVEVAGGSGWYYNAAWSPDGTMIAFQSVIVGPVGNIWIVNADGTGKTRLTGATKNSFDCTPKWIQYKEPQWSPDGTKLLFLNGLTRGNVSWGSDRLWVLELDLEKGLN